MSAVQYGRVYVSAVVFFSFSGGRGYYKWSPSHARLDENDDPLLSAGTEKERKRSTAFDDYHDELYFRPKSTRDGNVYSILYLPAPSNVGKQVNRLTKLFLFFS